jgi:hypothetical protein
METNRENKLDELLKMAAAQRAKPSDFLFTRIQARITRPEPRKIPLRLAYAAMILLFAFNAAVIVTGLRSQNKLQSVAQSMNLINDNNLYR